MKPQEKVKLKWSPAFAYVIGLIATDGNLSPNGRHIIFTSKDLEQVSNYKKVLGLTNKIGKKSNGSSKEKKYYVVQFGDVNFYSFLMEIGIMPAKSLTIGSINIPKEYFFDFLRGSFDGDGCTYSYYDPRWKNSFLFYLGFSYASLTHINWLRKTIFELTELSGHVSGSGKRACYQLRYAKTEAVKLIRKMYERENSICLNRKKLKINASLAIMNEPYVL